MPSSRGGIRRYTAAKGRRVIALDPSGRDYGKLGVRVEQQSAGLRDHRRQMGWLAATGRVREVERNHMTPRLGGRGCGQHGRILAFSLAESSRGASSHGWGISIYKPFRGERVCREPCRSGGFSDSGLRTTLASECTLL